LGGKVYSLEKGVALYIPAGMPHQFWNDEDEPAEGIIIMFGKGA
jgi:quercetin dioxygenase-like cupin family protein